jgi:hypothetical protein
MSAAEDFEKAWLEWLDRHGDAVRGLEPVAKLVAYNWYTRGRLDEAARQLQEVAEESR